MNPSGKAITTLVVSALMLSACGGGLSGTYSYHGDNPVMKSLIGPITFTFSGKTVEINMGLGQSIVGSYKVRDGKLYITGNGRTETYGMDDNGCILGVGGPMGGPLCKQD